MLEVIKRAKRAKFETDALLNVEGDDSSYAKHAKFATDALLNVGGNEDSCYA